jgi:thioredoxin reductase (NADPH)
MIGAEPNTDWLDGCVPLDRGGFVITGRDGGGQALASPYMTEKPGIFAVGDVRSGLDQAGGVGRWRGFGGGVGGARLPGGPGKVA